MSGTVRIGGGNHRADLAAHAHELVHTAYPALVLEIEVDTTRAAPASAVAADRPGLPDGACAGARVENLPLCTYPLAWVANPQLDLGPEPVTLERIARLPIITYPSNNAPYRVVRDMLTRAPAWPRRACTAAHPCP